METQRNKLSFKDQNIYVGIDVHQKQWKTSIMIEDLVYKTFSQDPVPELLVKHLRKNFPDGNFHSVYEAGFSGYWIHWQLKSLGVNSIVVNAADVPTTHKEKVQKEDKRDSKKLARELSKGMLNPLYIPSVETTEDRSLIRIRHSIVGDMVRNKNRIKSMLMFNGIKFPENFSKSQTHWSKLFMTWLASIKMSQDSGQYALQALIKQCEQHRVSLLEINREIKKLSKTPKYAKDAELVQSLPGFGLLTTMMFLTELETISRFSNIDKFAGFVGLVPSTRSSGENEKVGSITPRGHSYLREAIIESAWSAIRSDSALAHSYIKYCKRMNPNQAIIRIARKLLSRLMYVLNNEKPYEYAKIK